MNEEAGFIAALVADPSDRTAALVFADWLDERSDPRGPWMRIDEVRAWMAPKYANPIPDLIAALTNGKRITEAVKVLALIGEAAIPELVTLLSQQVASVRSRAMKALRMMGMKAKAALPALMEAAKDADYTVRSEASKATKALAKGGAVEKAALQEALQDKDQNIRSQAASLLGTMRAKRSVTKELAKGLDSPDPAERLAAVEAMAKLGTATAVEAFCKALADPVVEIRRIAAYQLSRHSSPTMTVAVEPLRKALADEDKDVRNPAVSALSRIGPAATAAITELLRLHAGADVKDRPRLLAALTAVGAGRPDVLAVILEDLHGPDRQVRTTASAVLSRWSALPASVVPGLLPLVRVPNPTWQERTGIQYALRALARVTDPPAEVLEEFRAQLATDNSTTVAEVLRAGGPTAKALVPELIAAFRRGEQFRTLEYAKTLGKIGDGIPALLQALDEPAGTNALTVPAAEGLKEAGAALLPFLPEVLARLREQSDPVARARLIDAVAAIGPAASGVVPDLIAMLCEEPTPDLGNSLFRALGAFGEAVAPFAPQLIELLRRSANAQHRAQVTGLITELIPYGVDALPVLREALRQAVAGVAGTSGTHQRLAAVRAAIKGLAALGPAAAEALPDLVSASEAYGSYSTGNVREEVLEAYGKIGAAALSHIHAAVADNIWKIRLAAINALGETGDTSAETMDALRKAEMDASQKVRNRAAAILRKMDKPKSKRK
jgi:uncharacterized protein (TIGR02996 family)